MDYLEAGATEAPPTLQHGMGNNPSTWAGVIVLLALLILVAARSSFRRFM